jgi:2-dehydro-3-deoxy-L-rhamnonate dehydrogenase (NAD+)
VLDGEGRRHRLTKAFAKEVAQAGIYVNAIAPAVIETDILQQVTPQQVQYMMQRIPMGRVGQPVEVAALIAWLASDECSFTTGQCIDISGGRATY